MHAKDTGLNGYCVVTWFILSEDLAATTFGLPKFHS